MALPDYSEVTDALDALEASVDAPEGHGILCGMLSAGTRVDDEAWMAQLLPEADNAGGSRELLRSLYKLTLAELGDPQFGFHPLLPDENRPLALRTEALSHWCSGFLYGLGLSGVTNTEGLPDDAAEVLGDLARIAGVDYELDEPGESEERAYAEVVEYVRVGTLLIFESLRGPGEHESVH